MREDDDTLEDDVDDLDDTDLTPAELRERVGREVLHGIQGALGDEDYKTFLGQLEAKTKADAEPVADRDGPITDSPIPQGKPRELSEDDKLMEDYGEGRKELSQLPQHLQDGLEKG